MHKSYYLRIPSLAGLLMFCSLCLTPRLALGERTVISLDGQWEIGEGGMDAAPAQFEHRVPVPGLVDEARPAFAEVGQPSPRREAFWYRRTFQVKGRRARRRGAQASQGGLRRARLPQRRSPGGAHAELHAGLFRRAAGLAGKRGRERTGRARRGFARGAAADCVVGLRRGEEPLYPGAV